jgi:hypothetical protein
VIGGSIMTNSCDSGDLSRLKITQSFNGHIEAVAFFDIAFNEDQIQQLILNGSPGVFQSYSNGRLAGRCRFFFRLLVDILTSLF